MFRNHLFNTEKLKYVKGKKSGHKCLLCAIRDRMEDVDILEVARTENYIVSVNLYPFNPGHLLVFPKRHVVDLSELTADEAMELHDLTVKAVAVIQEEFNPSGFNIGYNLGKGSGASIDHIHQQIVPRYENEIGYIDVLAGTRLCVADPNEVMVRLKEKFNA